MLLESVSCAAIARRGGRLFHFSVERLQSRTILSGALPCPLFLFVDLLTVVGVSAVPHRVRSDLWLSPLLLGRSFKRSLRSKHVGRVLLQFLLPLALRPRFFDLFGN